MKVIIAWAARIAIAGTVLVLSVAAALPAPRAAAAPDSLSTGTYTVPVDVTHQGNIDMGVGSVVIQGAEIGSVNVGTGEVEVSGTVTGAVQVGMGQLILGHAAHVGGKVRVGAGQVVRLAPGQPLPAVTRGGGQGFVGHNLPVNAGAGVGEIFGRLLGIALFGPFAAASVALSLVGRVAWWLVSLAVAFVLLSLFPEPTRRIAEDVERAPGSALGWGLLVVLASGPAAILLAITILGIPLALLLGLGLLAAKVMGHVAVSLLLGARVLPRLGVGQAAVGWELVAGTVLLLLVGSVPVLGFFVALIVGLIGIGACGRTGFGAGRPWFRAPPPPHSPSSVA